MITRWRRVSDEHPGPKTVLCYWPGDPDRYYQYQVGQVRYLTSWRGVAPTHWCELPAGPHAPDQLHGLRKAIADYDRARDLDDYQDETIPVPPALLDAVRNFLAAYDLPD